MTATNVLLPVVQDALNFALDKVQAWEGVPDRIAIARQAVTQLAAGAQADPTTLAQLTVDKQALDGIEQQYLGASSLLASVLETARDVQGGASPTAAQIADAGRLAGVIASGLGSLAQVEQDLRDRGAALIPGPGGGVAIPAAVKWALIGLGVWWAWRALS